MAYVRQRVERRRFGRLRAIVYDQSGRLAPRSGAHAIVPFAQVTSAPIGRHEDHRQTLAFLGFDLEQLDVPRRCIGAGHVTAARSLVAHQLVAAQRLQAESRPPPAAFPQD